MIDWGEVVRHRQRGGGEEDGLIGKRNIIVSKVSFKTSQIGSG